MESTRKVYPNRNPQNLREEIADILKMNEEERSFLNTVSLTHLIERLIIYTHSLEKEVAGRRLKKAK